MDIFSHGAAQIHVVHNILYRSFSLSNRSFGNKNQLKLDSVFLESIKILFSRGWCRGLGAWIKMFH